MRGRVVDYDDHKGYGYVQGSDGQRLFFHCTSIADGSRTVAVGAEVEFEVVTDPRGKPEAASLTST